jgi:hypothetical protein
MHPPFPQGTAFPADAPMYLIGGRPSVLPAYWVAHTEGGEVFQMGSGGEIQHHYTEIAPEGCAFWGLRCQHGLFGFRPQSGEVVLGDQARLLPGLAPGALSYRRCIVWDGEGLCTTMVEIGVGRHNLQVCLRPDFRVCVEERSGEA